MNPYNIYKKLLRNKKTRWVVVVVTILYIISPIDIIPEILIPLVGLLDDGIILTILVSELTQIFWENHRLNKSDQIKSKEPESNRIIDVESSSKN